MAVAQEQLPTEQTDRFLAGPEVAGHTAWMLVCSAMVLFMTAPGLALYYGGLVRKKNVLSIVMQCVFLMGLMTILWAIYGYSLAFGGATNPFFGNFQYLFMHGVAKTWNEQLGQSMTPMHDVVPTLPRMLHMLFQGMIFVITPAIICGAFAERMKFSAMVAFSVLWGTFVYCPLAHWVWGGGMLSYGGPYSIFGGALDFAGGTVVHISSGVSALVAAYVIGPRLGHRHEPMPPHNLTYTAIGASMLWIGWFGFNAGNAKAADGLAISAVIVTHWQPQRALWLGPRSNGSSAVALPCWVHARVRLLGSSAFLRLRVTWARWHHWQWVRRQAASASYRVQN